MNSNWPEERPSNYFVIRRAALKDLPGAQNTDGRIKLNKVHVPKRLLRLDLL